MIESNIKIAPIPTMITAEILKRDIICSHIF